MVSGWYWQRGANLIILSNLKIGNDGPSGAVVGDLTLWDTSGKQLEANYILTKNAAGFFYVNGSKLITASASLPVGNHSIRVRATAINANISESAYFMVTVEPVPDPVV
jgi:hypothetical protein